MKKLFALLLASLMLLSACGEQTSSSAQGESGKTNYTTFTSVYSTELTTVNYLKSTNTETTHLAYSIVDGLVEFDQYGLMIPSLAESWSVSEDELVYTLNLRKGVMWYTQDGEEYAEVKAQDFVEGAKWVLTADNASAHSSTIYNNIVGAKSYFDGETTDFSTVGIKALDDYTIEYTLIQPIPYFLKMLSFPAFYPVNGDFLESCGSRFGTDASTLLYCGAYIMTEYEPEYQRVLKMNENYWNKDIISIEKITYKYNKEADANGAELFLRGETDDVTLSSAIVDQWMQDESLASQMHPHQYTNMSYFMAFNFNPTYGEEYAPEDWITAVNNTNFRKAMFHAFDQDAAVMTMDSYNYESKILRTYTRRELVQVDDVDYTMMSGLDEYTNGQSFDAELAVEYKEKAMEELAGKVSFPIQVVMPYKTNDSTLTSRVQVIEQQMENVLGTDFIDIILVGSASSNFNSDVRNAGTWSFMELGWGPDYADPMSMFDPLLKYSKGENWGSIFLAQEYYDADLGYGTFEKMALAANEETSDLKKRYEMFAEAEKFLLDEALVIPSYVSGGGYDASYLDPFSGYTAQFGRNSLVKIKGAVVLDHSMSQEEYEAAYQEYLEARSAAREANPNG